MTTASLTLPRKIPFPALFDPVLDLLVAGGGISIILLLICMAGNLRDANAQTTAIVVWTTILINQPHYAATYYRIYKSKAEVQRYFHASVVLPLFLGFCAVIAILIPGMMAPLYCKAYFCLSGMHYSGQSYGVALIYVRKSGLTFNRLHKFCIAAPVFMSWIFGLLAGEIVGTQPKQFSGVIMPILNLPKEIFMPMQVTLVACTLAYVLLNIALYYKKKVILPFILHTIVVSHMTWFIGWNYNMFFVFSPVFHCFQYLLITTYFQLKSSTERGYIQISSPKEYLRSSPCLRYYATLIAIGVVLFSLVPEGISTAGICPTALATAVVLSFINLHHFVLDGSIWKLRKPELSKHFSA